MINNEKCKEYALQQIKGMGADFGGTNILKPLTACQALYRTGLKKRVFLLTDGAVCEPNRVIEQARSMRDDVRVFSFGLGSGCDENLVTQVAKAGRGTSTIVRDGSADLNGQVIKALSASMEPSFCDTKYGFNNQLQEKNELFRNTLISEKMIISVAQLADLKFNFQTKDDESHEALNLEFTQADFV